MGCDGDRKILLDLGLSIWNNSSNNKRKAVDWFQKDNMTSLALDKDIF